MWPFSKNEPELDPFDKVQRMERIEAYRRIRMMLDNGYKLARIPADPGVSHGVIPDEEITENIDVIIDACLQGRLSWVYPPQSRLAGPPKQHRDIYSDWQAPW